MSDSKRSAIALLLAATMPAAAAEAARTPLYWLWHEKQTDSAYTVSEARRAWLVRERGYADMGPNAYVDAYHAAHSRPLKCFYAGAPRTNTFCSTSRLEQRLIGALGYAEVGVEGFVQTERSSDNTTLYRVSRVYENNDREHRLVTSGREVARLRKEGWAFDGSKGFVYPIPEAISASEARQQ